MTKIRITGFESITPRLRIKLTSAISRSGFSKELASEIATEIRENGIKPGLEPSSVKSRERLAALNPTHPDFEAGKSNLTLTGQLLNSMRSKLIGSRLVFIVESLSRKHKRYIGAGKGKQPTLAEIFGWQKESGRDIAQVFTRESFIQKLSDKLRSAILKNYRN